MVIGAGAMGLAAAYEALKQGHSVQVIEAAADPGGMAAHFQLGGVSIERYYHFICKTDLPTFEMLDELGIRDKMRWRTTTMGIFMRGKLYPWGNPAAMLHFPEISLISRLRYGLFAFVCTHREHWDSIETETAKNWITRWCGKEVYDKLWAPLFGLKFYEYAENISAAWIWTRIKRIGRSRRSLMQEELGYLEGGSETLVNALCEKIRGMGGIIRLDQPVTRVVSEAGRITGVQTQDGYHPADHVISTVPTPLISQMIPQLPKKWTAKYESIHNIGVCCLVYQLKRSVSPHFWVNVSEPDIEIPGFVEFSNLRPMKDNVVYIPYYMPTFHPKYSWTDGQLTQEGFRYLCRINPALTADDVIASSVARLRYAQPVCEPGFAAKLPPLSTPIAGLQIADTCFYYPEDRGIAESIRLGREMARFTKASGQAD